MKVYSASFEVPASVVSFWKKESRKRISPEKEKSFNCCSRPVRGNWEVKYSDGVVFDILYTIENGLIRFVGEAWKMGQEAFVSLRPRRNLLGKYRAEVDGAIYEVELKESLV